MVNPLHCCVFLPVTLLATLCTDTGHNSTFVCVGDSVRVFQDITSTSFKSNIIIYKKLADKAEAIFTRTMGKDIIHEKYKDKVFLENGAILIHKFQVSDEANYVILYNDTSKRKDVQLCASAPPTKSCKPTIEEDGNILTVSLGDHNYCGKPVVSVYWMESPNISYIAESVIELPSGSESEAGTYRACMKGEALTCVKSRTGWDSCVNYTTKSMRGGNNDPAASTVIPQTKTNDFTTVVIVSIVLFIVSLVLIGVILIIFILRRQSGNLSKLKPATEQHGRASSESSMRNHSLLEDESGSDGEQRNEEDEDDTNV